MKRTAAIGLLAVLVVALATAQDVSAKDRQPQTKSVTGQVVDNNGQAIPNAIVYLKNTKTLAVKTFIAQNDGTYQFHGLSPNADYELYAESGSLRSDSKTISQFDSKTSLTIHLKIKK